jgi:glutamate-1-semialdehyde 2,1-aminomutase
MTDPSSESLFERAERVIVGGVNSPVRAFKAVGGHPIFIERARGSKIVGADGTEYIDYVGSWGPAILGHAHPDIVARVKEVAESGLSFGAPTAREVDFAEAVRKLYPSMELLRAVSSGTEATMSALRVARGATGRDKIIKFDGAYHGHTDCLLVKAGSGAATLGAPDSAGVPKDMVKNTITLPYNDSAALEAAFAKDGANIACVIVEPVAGNMGCVPPVDGFLESILSITKKHGALTIFDEVMTGCRVSKSGAQGRYGLTPDLTCLGKIVGGGMPLAVYGGRRELMEKVAPLGPIYQAGTLSGNPLATAAGLATLERLTDDVYATLEARGAALEAGIVAALQKTGVTGTVQRVASMITLFFNPNPVKSWDDAKQSDTARFGRFHQKLIEGGIYWPPSQYEAAFISHAHSEADIEATVRGIETALASC